MSDENKKDPLEQSAEAGSEDAKSAAAGNSTTAEGEEAKPGDAVSKANTEGDEATPAERKSSRAAAGSRAKLVEANADAGSEAAKADALDEAKAQTADRSLSDSEVAQTAKPKASAESPEPPAGEKATPSDADKEAKAKAAAEARAARASARAKKTESEEDAAPKEPSPLQPRLDHLVKLLKQTLGDETVQEAFINEKSGHLPCVVIKKEKWTEAAELLKQHSELKLDYLRNVSGVDYETHMEVVYHLLSLLTKHEYCIKVRTDREAPSITSVTPIWPTADWNEREIYDLLGIAFPGHPDLRRIMMSDDWVGHPLRKDYEPLDPEV